MSEFSKVLDFNFKHGEDDIFNASMVDKDGDARDFLLKLMLSVSANDNITLMSEAMEAFVQKIKENDTICDDAIKVLIVSGFLFLVDRFNEMMSDVTDSITKEYLS